MSTRKIVAVVVAVALVALVFVACPNDGGGGGGGNSVTSLVEMVRIEGGTFQMGSPTTEANRDSDEDQHSVTVSSFSIGKYQVTQAQYQAVIGSLPSSLPSSNYGVGNNYPVYYVSWYDAIVFCNRLSMREGLSPAYLISGSTDPTAWGSVPTSSDATWNAVQIISGANGYRLPTEAQWEYACRAGTTTAYNTGAAISDNTGWYGANSDSKTHEVGRKPPNAWGLYDMHGNVFEWCWDWYGNYPSGVQTDPTGANPSDYRVVRGGSWYADERHLRSAYRLIFYPDSGSNTLGFRLVRP